MLDILTLLPGDLKYIIYIYVIQTTLTDLYMSSWVLLNWTFFYSQTGAIDRSTDIMMQIDHRRLRECGSLYSPEKLVRKFIL